MIDYFTNLAQTFLLISAALFPIINPPGTALLFLAMTRRLSRVERNKLARQVAFYAAIIILTSLVIGSYVLTIFGISLPVLRMAGGIVVSLMGWQMLSAPAEDEQATAKAISPTKGNAAFYPLTMPLTAGPGTIAACIALGTTRPRGPGLFGTFLLGGFGAVVAIAALIYVCFRYADRIERVLGNAGSEAFARLFSFILLCIGIQTFWLGFAGLWETLPAK